MVGSFVGAFLHMLLTVWQFDTNLFKKGGTNEVSNDNSGLDDAALRI